MANRSLAGGKITVLVESQSIPARPSAIRTDRRLRHQGAVDVSSSGPPKQAFVSEVEEAARTPERFDVVIDVAQVKLDQRLPR